MVTRIPLKFPSSVDELRALSKLLSSYKADHFLHVLLLFSFAYLYKQTFAIPGSVFMNVLAGAIFGLWLGFLLTCLLTACGATLCYSLSYYFGRKTVMTYFPERVKGVQKQVSENADGLFFFLLFLRLFPMSPNWFMNIVAPIISIPVHLFFPSVLIGLMPYNFICVQTGCILSHVSSISDILTWSTSLKLGGIACAALVPGLLLRKYKHSQVKYM
ncbi:hypothetical protein CAPTEDRAFT_223354 [Capitella teleta]|uniref:VTT domain-containing protein n=2 Tax=Capitella teleta TaxID=283909 RepID=R7UX64_CAPTE|nr:hypothetical protein CAPTEDRAFT_223354 [Capitella teleta]|eukprot:ELU10877.1 hypothetical protein CAPTEDRAFT_223354 [Capitella teleta]